MKKLALILCLMGLAQSALAEQFWSARNVYVEEISFFHENSRNILRVFYAVPPDGEKDPIPDCVPNNTVWMTRDGMPVYQASMIHDNTSADQEVHMSLLTAAQAQNARIDIRFEHADGCDTNTRYGYGGTGREFDGIRVHRPQ